METVTSLVRKATPDDIDIIHRILDMEPFKYDDDLPYERAWIEQLVVNDRCLTLVYESAHEIKGFISAEIMVSGAAMIWFCAVKPEYQQAGIGIRLYATLEKACREAGVNGLLAYGFKTSAGMLDRLHFYSGEHTYREFYKPLVIDN